MEISKLIKKDIKVKDVMLTIGSFPFIKNTSFLKEAIDLMDKYRLGIICVVNENKNLEGIITDGDLRRNLTLVQRPLPSYFMDNVLKHCSKPPLKILEDENIEEALNIIEKNEIWDLPVVNKKDEIVGLLHLHNIIRKIL